MENSKFADYKGGMGFDKESPLNGLTSKGGKRRSSRRRGYLGKMSKNCGKSRRGRRTRGRRMRKSKSSFFD